MPLINCKKCKENIDMPSTRFKICNRCNKRNRNRNTSIIVKETKSNESNILDIFFLLDEIASYLTIYDTYNLYLSCKEFQKILSADILWTNMLYRDFNIEYPIQRYEDLSPIKCAILIDTNIICHDCKMIYNKKCTRECSFSLKKISKTKCIQYYQITEDELSQFQRETKYNNFFKKNITMFNNKEIRVFVCRKYKGITNFKLFRQSIEDKKLLKRQKMLDNKNNKEIEFKKWKDEYIKNFDYMSMTNEERHILLINTFKEHNVIYRADSHLCNHFIRGFIDDKCIEHITAIIKMTSILFSYHNII